MTRLSWELPVIGERRIGIIDVTLAEHVKAPLALYTARPDTTKAHWTHPTRWPGGEACGGAGGGARLLPRRSVAHGEEPNIAPSARTVLVGSCDPIHCCSSSGQPASAFEKAHATLPPPPPLAPPSLLFIIAVKAPWSTVLPRWKCSLAHVQPLRGDFLQFR